MIDDAAEANSKMPATVASAHANRVNVHADPFGPQPAGQEAANASGKPLHDDEANARANRERGSRSTRIWPERDGCEPEARKQRQEYERYRHGR